MVVDDHPLVREGVAAAISTEPDLHIIAEAGSGRQAFELFCRYRPDVTLMDLRMPDMSGVEATTLIRRDNPKARVLVLTAFDADEDIYRALKAGAEGCLLKGAFRDEVIKAIRTVHAGRRYISPAVAQMLAERVGSPDLTPREMDVLKLIVKGMSNKEIAAALFITEGTVKWYVINILGKLNVHDRTQAVTVALSRGIVHLDQ